MDNYTMQRLLELYGAMPGLAPEFIRFPPGLRTSASGPHPGFRQEFSSKASSLYPNIDDYQQMYRQYAKGLLSINDLGPAPPGHPLHMRRQSFEALNAENSKLQKENIELRRQIKDMNGSKARQDLTL